MIAAAMSGTSADPCVGKFLEFRIVRDPASSDQSRVLAATDTLIPNPDLTPTIDRTATSGTTGGGGGGSVDG